MVNNMRVEKKESLRQYLSYNKDMEEINRIFVNLDNQMKYLHQKGYCIGELNSDSIVLEQSKYDTDSNESVFMFSSIVKSLNPTQDYLSNIVDLTKLAMGAFLSSENGFCDYSQLSTDYIKKYFSEIRNYLPNKEYFEQVITNDNTLNYYSDYVAKKEEGRTRSNSIQKTKATQYGKMYTNDEEAAFIQLVFYPVIIISIITVIAVFSKIFG